MEAAIAEMTVTPNALAAIVTGTLAEPGGAMTAKAADNPVTPVSDGRP